MHNACEPLRVSSGSNEDAAASFHPIRLSTIHDVSRQAVDPGASLAAAGGTKFVAS